MSEGGIHGVAISQHGRQEERRKKLSEQDEDNKWTSHETNAKEEVNGDTQNKSLLGKGTPSRASSPRVFPRVIWQYLRA